MGRCCNGLEQDDWTAGVGWCGGKGQGMDGWTDGLRVWTKSQNLAARRETTGQQGNVSENIHASPQPATKLKASVFM